MYTTTADNNHMETRVELSNFHSGFRWSIKTIDIYAWLQTHYQRGLIFSEIINTKRRKMEMTSVPLLPNDCSIWIRDLLQFAFMFIKIVSVHVNETNADSERQRRQMYFNEK